jgi:hypothetical protein
MNLTNNLNNDDDERKVRWKLGKILMYGLLVVIGFIIVLVVWVTQPLLFSSKIEKTQISIDSTRLEAHVRQLSEEFHPRNFANSDRLNLAAEYIKTEFSKSGGSVKEQTFFDEKKEYRNIIVSFGPENGERIIIGAHYDSCFDTPGADDNASGVAGLIELARLFGKEKPSVRIDLVAYTLEEPPFFSTEQMGSFVHAKSLQDENAKVRLMICLEMIGYFSDEKNSQKFPIPGMGLIFPDQGNFISVVGNFTNILTTRKIKRLMDNSTVLPVYSINAPAFLPGIDFSDHKNYWNFGFEAVMITDTAFFRNQNYHTLKDTADTLDYKKMALVVEATFDAVKKIAEN